MSKEPTQCYAINADMFFDNFREELDILESMRDRTVETMFQMVDDPEAPTYEQLTALCKDVAAIRDEAQRARALARSTQQSI